MCLSDDPDLVRAARRDSTCSFYQPPPPTEIEKMRRSMIKEQKVFALIREILGNVTMLDSSKNRKCAILRRQYIIFVCDPAYMAFMWVLLLVAYGQRDPNAYFLTRHIQQSFSKDISSSKSIQDVFTWANTTLLTNLFGDYPGNHRLTNVQMLT